jgi:hypothetical protein
MIYRVGAFNESGSLLFDFCHPVQLFEAAKQFVISKIKFKGLKKQPVKKFQSLGRRYFPANRGVMQSNVSDFTG